MSRISESALVRLARERASLQRSLPLAARMATSSPDPKAATTVSPDTAGVEAERIRADSDSAVPSQVSTALYYASIAAAFLAEHRITTLSDEELQEGFAWMQVQPWVDATTHGLAARASTRLSELSRKKTPNTVANK